MNCRTHEHRQFERILQVCAHCTPTLVSGSVDTRSIFFIVWSVITYNGQIKMPAQCSAVAQQHNSWILMMGWLQLRLHRVRRVGTCLSYIPYLRSNIIRYSIFRPDIKGDYPPNLSILISGGKENNCDSLSNGE